MLPLTPREALSNLLGGGGQGRVRTETVPQRRQLAARRTCSGGPGVISGPSGEKRLIIRSLMLTATRNFAFWKTPRQERAEGVT